jgi:TRIAD3 protein (E3 ubiquitin-protein ligase RNF216)
MARCGFRDHQEVVVLSDSEDEGYARHELDLIDAQSPSPSEILRDFEDPIADFHAQYAANDRGLIDLTGIPDVDVPPSDPVTADNDTSQQDAQTNDWGNAEVVTEAACLQMILSVLPDISVDYVLKLIQQKTTDLTRTSAQCEHFLTELLEGEPYPKESDERTKNRKRKRADEGDGDEDLSNYEKAERDPEIGGYEHDA